MEEVTPVYVPQASMGDHVMQLFHKVAGRGRGGTALDKRTETIHFIMPLAGRLVYITLNMNE